MFSHYVLYLFCLSCTPQQTVKVEDIQIYSSMDSNFAQLYCRDLGDIYTGRESSDPDSPAMKKLLQGRYAYRCILESGDV